jgi:hypothetical protein
MKTLRTLVNNSMATTPTEEKVVKPVAAPSEKPAATVAVSQSTMDALLAKMDEQEKQIKMSEEPGLLTESCPPVVLQRTVGNGLAHGS